MLEYAYCRLAGVTGLALEWAEQLAPAVGGTLAVAGNALPLEPAGQGGRGARQPPVG